MDSLKPICIIPARGGSKRIPRKNIKSFCGKPIIAYSIQNALESKISSAGFGIDFGADSQVDFIADFEVDLQVDSKTKSKKHSKKESKTESKTDSEKDCATHQTSHQKSLLSAMPLFSTVVVSTDDKQIAKIAQKYGAAVPFLRPSNLADDTTATLPVIAHALDCLRSLGVSIKDDTPICVLYPTAPLIDSSDILRSFEVFLCSKCEYVFFANELPKNPLRGFTLESTQNIQHKCTPKSSTKTSTKTSSVDFADSSTLCGTPQMLFSRYQNVRSQDLPPVYVDAGVLYWGRASSFLAQKPIFSSHSRAIALEPSRSQDIDTMSDWQLAKRKFLAKAPQRTKNKKPKK
ncbi:hypothetical protein CQA40_05505 [Helicobacter sp. MIT 01-3238]|nr:hypothetical protein CQA40_05505 [Helicobacter sp. MIT 01-3238]